MRPYHRELIDEVRRLGGRGAVIRYSGRHPRLRFSIGDRDFNVVVAGSPAPGHRSVANAIAEIRRLTAARHLTP
jgi:hypothetical protein